MNKSNAIELHDRSVITLEIREHRNLSPHFPLANLCGTGNKPGERVTKLFKWLVPKA